MSERPNDSALSLSWLMSHIQSVEGAPRATAAEGWRSCVAQMRALAPGIGESTAAPDSDIWLCKSHTVLGDALVPVWAPPDRLDDFGPPLPEERLATWQFRATQHAALDSLVSEQAIWTDEEMLARRNDALKFYFSARGLAHPPFFDPARRRVVVLLNQWLRWLETAVGSFFKGLFLTPIDAPDDLEAIAGTAAQLIERVARAGGAPFAELQLLELYNHPWEAGTSFEVHGTPGRQSELWRERWGWLSQDTAPDDARRALTMPAALLANPAVVHPLLFAAMSGDAARSSVALCTLRRMALALRAMAWAEDALQRDWTLVRPKDLLCFAYSALKPEWPRRGVALSHRSRTVKPLLLGTRFWSSPSSAVDASYVPQWETNISMIWGLFAPASATVRMASRDYLESEWCRRESEMLDHLVERCDFWRGRVVVDSEEAATSRLDTIIADPAEGRLRVFPAPVELVSAPLLKEGQIDLLSAAGAVRLIAYVAEGRAATVAAAIRMLCLGKEPALTCPTNNPDGWGGYMALFQNLAPISSDLDELPIQLAQDYDEPTRDRERDWWAKSSPDFDDPRVPSLRDHLCASGWLRAMGWVSGHDVPPPGIVIDCRDLARDDWERDPGRALHRGLTSAATTSPVWFLQRADARVDQWPLVGDYRPIFTQYFDAQFSWMVIRPAYGDGTEAHLRDGGLVYSAVVLERQAS